MTTTTHEPLFILRNQEKAAELIRLCARPKKYRNVEDANACFMFMTLDALERGRRERRRQLEMLTFVRIEGLSPEGRLDREQQLRELYVALRRTATALTSLHDSPPEGRSRRRKRPSA